MLRISKEVLDKLDLDFYTKINTKKIAEYQLKMVNKTWKYAIENIAYYKKIHKLENLPENFKTIAEYANTIPFLDKTIISNNDQDIFDRHKKNDLMRITSGSTGRPVQMPAWKSEFEQLKLSNSLGRKWYGISPGDKLFLFWGHGHLLGHGFSGALNRFKRSIKDKIQNYVRYSCYDLTEKNLLMAGDAIIRTKPLYIIGYSFALDQLARANIHRKHEFSKLNIKAVIGTAENFPFSDSRDVISNVFGTPIAMEYGSVETNLIAHTMPHSGYQTFWRDYLLEKIGHGDRSEVVVTSLYPRMTPLIRYKLGDEISFDDSSIFSECRKSIIQFSEVVGRCNNPVILPSGRKLHSEVVSHLVRDESRIKGYQFLCYKDRIELNIISNGNIFVFNDLCDNLNQKAKKIDKELALFLVVNNTIKLERSLSGKVPTVVYK
jgi:phenylacetate-CoA ligase